jgi:protocatechuate 3,4-dioxygenase beta subunit
MKREFRIDRRAALARIGGGALALLPLEVVRATEGSAMPACVVTPAQTEGPYFVDERLNRIDVRADPGNGAVKEGVPLKLKLVAHAIAGSACAALAGAIVDIWHCDARGVYSDVDEAKGQKFLRGYQTTGGDGSVDFVTIYPGWYPGRAAHIHFKVRGRTTQGRGYEFTSQLYFDEATSDRVYARAPYKDAGRRTRNDDDFLYRHGGKALTLALAPDGGGYAAQFDIGLRTA